MAKGLTRNFLLFIDTEASGLPQKWHLPYSAEGAWPHVLQVAWQVCTEEGEVVKEENHFICEEGVTISPAARKVHNLTESFLQAHGKGRRAVLERLQYDLQQYRPRVVGHFMAFDYHLLSAEFYRAGMENSLALQPPFCTMLASAHLVQNPAKKYLRLYELYETLFGQPPDCRHNALSDARATAACFFELLQRGDIDARKIAEQQPVQPTPVQTSRRSRFIFALLIVLLFMLLMLYYLWTTGLIS